eukprot:g9498.t1
MGVLDLASLAKRVESMGRGQLRAGPQAEVTLRIWLGDLAMAKQLLEEYSPVDDGASHAEALGAALTQLLAELPGAAERSVAFVPRRLPQAVAEQKGKLLCGTLELRSKAQLSYVLLLKDGMVGQCGTCEQFVTQALSELKALVSGGLAEMCLLDYRGFGWSSGSASVAHLRQDAEESGRDKLPGSGWRGPALILDSPVTCQWPLEAVPSWPRLAEAMDSTLRPCERPRVCMCCSTKSAKKLQTSREKCYLETEDLLRAIDLPLLYINGTADVVCPHTQAVPCFEAHSSHTGYLPLAQVDGQLRACTCSFDRKLRHYNIVISKEIGGLWGSRSGQIPEEETRSIPLNKFREVFQGTEPEDIATPLDELCATMVTTSPDRGVGPAATAATWAASQKDRTGKGRGFVPRLSVFAVEWSGFGRPSGAKNAPQNAPPSGGLSLERFLADPTPLAPSPRGAMHFTTGNVEMWPPPNCEAALPPVGGGGGMPGMPGMPTGGAAPVPVSSRLAKWVRPESAGWILVATGVWM